MDRKAAMCLIIFVFGVGCLWIKIPPNPELCALCGTGGVYHAPCVINVSTGVITELAPSAPGPGQAGEPENSREVQIFRMAEAGKIGLDIHRLPNRRTCTAYLTTSTPINRRLFCASCRKRLPREGYALLELREAGGPVIRPVEEHAAEALGEYDVSIAKQEGMTVIWVSTGPQ